MKRQQPATTDTQTAKATKPSRPRTIGVTHEPTVFPAKDPELLQREIGPAP